MSDHKSIDWPTATLAEIEDVNVTARDNEGRTLLHLAAGWSKNPDVIDALIEKGADLNARDKDGSTPLHYATINKEHKIGEALIRRGANVNAKDKNGATPLHCAIEEYGYEEPDMMCHLIENGADIEALDEKSRSPLLFAAELAQDEPISILIENGADLRGRDNNGNTLLHLAVAKENAEISEILSTLEALGPAVMRMCASATNNRGQTPLHVAAEKNIYENETTNEVMYSLMPEDASSLYMQVNVFDEDDNTPLFLAVANNNINAVQFFINHDAELNHENKEGMSPLHIAVKKLAEPEFEDELYPDIELAKRLIFYGANPNNKNEKGQTPLHLAVVENNQGVISVLLKCEARKDHHIPMDVSIKDADGKTALELGEKNPDFYGSDAYWLLNDATYNQKDKQEKQSEEV